MPLPSSDTPLYSHALPQIERWLREQGCKQNESELHCWYIEKDTWKADIWLDVEQVTVRYIGAAENNQDIQRSFKYSLSRQDVEKAVFDGP